MFLLKAAPTIVKYQPRIYFPFPIKERPFILFTDHKPLSSYGKSPSNLLASPWTSTLILGLDSAFHATSVRSLGILRKKKYFFWEKSGCITYLPPDSCSFHTSCELLERREYKFRLGGGGKPKTIFLNSHPTSFLSETSWLQLGQSAKKVWNLIPNTRGLQSIFKYFVISPSCHGDEISGIINVKEKGIFHPSMNRNNFYCSMLSNLINPIKSKQFGKPKAERFKCERFYVRHL